MRQGLARKGQLIVLFFFFVFLPKYVLAQFNYPELYWRVIETPHFLIHYHQQEENFVQQVARIAEEIYPGVTSDLGYQPLQRTPIVVENYNDMSGGYASILMTKIVVQAPWDPTRASGDLSWIRQVIAHEFTHIVTFAAIEESIFFPLRRFTANLILPMWFIEGLAQYEGEKWHSLKEMVVTDEARRKKIMSEADLGAFYFFEGWGRTSGYYQSDSFVRYIFENYGKDKIGKILAHLRHQPFFRWAIETGLTTKEVTFYPFPRFLSFNQALKEVLGKNSSLLYSEWRDWIIKKYEERELSSDYLLTFGELLTSQGRRNEHPVFSPSDEKIAFVSNRGYDYAIFDLYLMDLKSKATKKLDKEVNFFISFSPDGGKILYSKTEFYPPRRSFLSDLYLIDIKTRKRTRLTYGLRASQASFSPDGEKIVFAKNEGGNSNLYLLDLETYQISPLTYDLDGLTQNFSPCFSPCGKIIVFSSFRQGKRDIYLLDLANKTITSLTFDKADDRCPSFSPDAKKIYFVSDREDGIFNLYSLDLKGEKLQRYTRISGGVFEPNISSDGKKIVLSAYEKGRFVLYLLSLEALKAEQLILSDRKKVTLIAETEEDKEEVYSSFPYQPRLKFHYIFPWFSFTERESFLSLEGYASDVLEKHNFYFSTLISGGTQYKMSYINRSFLPTFWINLYEMESYNFFRDKFYTTEIAGGSLGLTYYINNLQGVGVNYSNQWVDTSFFGSSEELKSWQGKINSVGVVWGFADLVPVCDPAFGREGKRMQLAVEYSGRELGSSIEYTAYKMDWRRYRRLSRRGTLAFRVLAKRVENRQSFPRVLFSLGGVSHLRGYPRDYVVGENLFFFSSEYRFLWLKRIGGSSTLYLDRLGGVLFFDIGDAWGKDMGEGGKERMELKQAVGVELRLKVLPFGKYSLVLRLGLVWPLDGDEKEANVFFTIGNVF